MQSRTPTQVASHAQKYFIRQNNLNKRKRRSSLFDIVSEAPAEPVKAPEVASKVPAGMPGGLSMAFAAGMPGFPGFNPATMPMPFAAGSSSFFAAGSSIFFAAGSSIFFADVVLFFFLGAAFFFGLTSSPSPPVDAFARVATEEDRDDGNTTRRDVGTTGRPPPEHTRARDRSGEDDDAGVGTARARDIAEDAFILVAVLCRVCYVTIDNWTWRQG